MKSRARRQYTCRVGVSTGILWIVATPIGTLGDLSSRAKEVLENVDLILSEDTRRARALLSHLGLGSRGRLQSLHEHNEERKLPLLLRRLREGDSIALISDAGTPVVSDPGFLLVRAAREGGLEIRSVPGASAFITALAASGQPPLPATLCGFLPPRKGARRRLIAELGASPWTTVVLLSPHRLARELADLADVLGGERPATLLAELSKVHERAVSASLSELADSEEAKTPKGEYILVVAPPEREEPSVAPDSELIRSEYRRALGEGMDRREALRAAAGRLGIHRRLVFDVVASDPNEGGEE
jgi:16S rRNA (cytidine1402-2'-O)-methyltransferase